MLFEAELGVLVQQRRERHQRGLERVDFTVQGRAIDGHGAEFNRPGRVGLKPLRADAGNQSETVPVGRLLAKRLARRLGPP